MGLLIFPFPRADAKAVIDREETRTPQAVLFEIANTLANTMHDDKMDILDLLFEAIAKDLPDDLKLAWLAQLGGAEDKEKFSSLLNTLELEWVRQFFCVISAFYVQVSQTAVQKYNRCEGHHIGGTLLQEFADWTYHEDFVRIILDYGYL